MAPVNNLKRGPFGCSQGPRPRIHSCAASRRVAEVGARSPYLLDKIRFHGSVGVFGPRDLMGPFGVDYGSWNSVVKPLRQLESIAPFTEHATKRHAGRGQRRGARWPVAKGDEKVEDWKEWFDAKIRDAGELL
ncbi:hypothetical protein KSP40_PGU006674 [Platanthera guangdongensis]|uniref:Uncharacterized protein n=1 Tax=Platanthera guangdongensis TaxID=2320717 RepID=A0ABR2LCX3_9ASPA